MSVSSTSLGRLITAPKANASSSLPSPATSTLGSPASCIDASGKAFTAPPPPPLPIQDDNSDNVVAASPSGVDPSTPPLEEKIAPPSLDDQSSLSEVDEQLGQESDSSSSEEDDNDDDDTVAAPKSAKKKSNPAPNAARKCSYCGTTSTPMWRHGPGDYTNLCNSCGVKWRRGKILSSGDNRHHLCKNSSAAKPKKVNTTPKSKAASTTTTSVALDTATAPNSSQKRKVSFDDWDLPRTRKARSCARKLWSGHSVSSENDFDEETVVGEKSVAKKAEPEPPVVETEQPSVEIVTQSPPTAVSAANERIRVLTSEFAGLLEKLDPAKTSLFTSVLAKSFEPKVAHAYQIGYEVEMSVLDISPETWTALRAIVNN